MSLLAQQVAGLMQSYRPPVPRGGRINRIYDDPDPDLPERDTEPKVCKTCEVEKAPEDYYLRADGRPYSDCKVCYNLKKKQAIEAKRK